MSLASDPFTGSGLLWTGNSAGRALAQDGDWSNHPSLGFGRDDERSWNHPALVRYPPQADPVRMDAAQYLLLCS